MDCSPNSMEVIAKFKDTSALDASIIAGVQAVAL
jgi:hypothetical protein